jgi:hypothetical protein
MNFEFGAKINPELSKLDFDKAIRIGETELKKIVKSDFHEVLGKSFTNPVDDLVNWVSDFYAFVSRSLDVKVLYFEMVEFDINTDVWYINGFAYNEDGGLNPYDMEWLSDNCSSEAMTLDEFILTGFESLQSAFESVEEKQDNDEWTEEMQDARDWCEQIIIARFMELMTKAHEKAKQQKLGWGNIPIYFTEHGYDFIVRSDP